MIQKYNIKLITSLLKWTVFLLLLGRAWQCFYWGIPIRALVWNQYLIEPIVNLFGIDWKDFVTSSFFDSILVAFTKLNGVFFLVGATLILMLNKTKLWIEKYFYFLTVPLLFLAVLYYLEKFMRIGQLMEYSSQIVSPILLALFYFDKWKISNRILLIKIAIALTFVGHGLYAIGIYPVPGSFIDMIINIFGVNQATAVVILKVAGVLDFFVAIGIFIPKLSKQL
jgi:hypothetical protein